MRIDSVLVLLDLRRRFALRALVLATALLAAACNEADGTDEWPGVYPHEKDIDRPKGAKDAGGAKDGGGDAGSGDGGTLDGGATSDAASDTGASSDAAFSDAGGDGGSSDGSTATDGSSPG